MEDPKVWASRLATGSDGLKMIKKAVQGMEDMRLMTIEDMHTIDNDRHRRAQVAKRVPVDKRRDPKERIFTSGSIFYVDNFTYSGKDQVRQIADRTGTTSPTACMHAIDASDSRYKYGRNVSRSSAPLSVEIAQVCLVRARGLGLRTASSPAHNCQGIGEEVGGEDGFTLLFVRRERRLAWSPARRVEAVAVLAPELHVAVELGL
jgi:hypothetical protein